MNAGVSVGGEEEERVGAGGGEAVLERVGEALPPLLVVLALKEAVGVPLGLEETRLETLSLGLCVRASEGMKVRVGREEEETATGGEGVPAPETLPRRVAEAQREAVTEVDMVREGDTDAVGVEGRHATALGK